MEEPITILALLGGLTAGLAHAAAGPDHLAAVAPLAVQRRQAGWRIGVAWGLGHAAAVALVGVLALALRDALPLDFLSSVSERLVGILIIGVGLWGLRAALESRVHDHPHDHKGVQHQHAHLHLAADPDARRSHRHGHAIFGIGAIHGLAGGSHLVAALTALAFPSTALAGVYLTAYGLGSVLTMALFAGLMAWAARRLAKRADRYIPPALALTSLAAVAVGAFWLTSAQLGF